MARQVFTASKGSGQGYVWSFLENRSGGSLTPSGEYQAGPVGGVTDVVQVMDSFANSATATVNVTRPASVVSAAGPQATAMGCASTGSATVPALPLILALLGWRSLGRPRRAAS